jgi:diguanylate cyclase (GGDEF)-like protein
VNLRRRAAASDPRLPILAGATGLAGAALFVVVARGDAGRWASLPLAVVIVAFAAAAFVGWRQARARGAADLARLDDAWRLEREWVHELRAQILRMHEERGLLGDTGDVRGLVLRIAVTLLEAEKGMLLSHEEDRFEGDFTLVCFEGFESDPSHSAIARRFASEVIERDRAVRVERADVLAAASRTAADEEIDNLVAIPIYVQDQPNGVVICANRRGGFGEFDDDVLLALGDQAGAVLQNSRLRGELRGTYVATVRMLAEAIEAKDPFLRGHSDEVSTYVAAVAEQLEFDPKRREEVVFGSLLHDIGKIGISERILLKPGPLSPEERGVVQLHPRIGYRLVEQVPALRPIAAAILHHHERFDGDGYPSGLRGEEIPLEARIICVADSFSAMTAERPYRGRMSLEEACAELERCAGAQFDPEIVRLFTQQVRERPPTAREAHALAAVLADPEIDARRSGEEPILGHGSFAVTDNLTLLYSHRYFHEVARAEAERAALQDGRFAVSFIEADVAAINRDEGYAAGDGAIQAAAQAVQRAAVRSGGTACRYGGRRLGLLVRDADDPTAERILSEISADLDDAPRIRCAHAVWRAGESGEDVIARARLDLGRRTQHARLV